MNRIYMVIQEHYVAQAGQRLNHEKLDVSIAILYRIDGIDVSKAPIYWTTHLPASVLEAVSCDATERADFALRRLFHDNPEKVVYLNDRRAVDGTLDDQLVTVDQVVQLFALQASVPAGWHADDRDGPTSDDGPEPF